MSATSSPINLNASVHVDHHPLKTSQIAFPRTLSCRILFPGAIWDFKQRLAVSDCTAILGFNVKTSSARLAELR
ncbi:hypothetical protein OUZ56_000568 [Daphnia magna]|uniref:Uncharacterized protein n=1 Tax=Daphnia magna TaxID=35525 RepID=A0ABR0A028_9CRUS|nr:hypothetical protein OUZ56_000568 [Daphnia magna]